METDGLTQEMAEALLVIGYPTPQQYDVMSEHDLRRYIRQKFTREQLERLRDPG
jgi:hypothetical protein